MQLRKPLLPALTLSAIVAIASILLSVGAHFSKDQLKISREQHLIEQLYQLNIGNFDNNPLQQLQATQSSEAVYPLYQGKTLLGHAIRTVAKDGYSGDIHLLIGIDTQGNITAVQPLEHQETPGLGDRIERSKSDWIDGFNEMAITQADEYWRMKKDEGRFDNLTGATITARAILKHIQKTLQTY